MTSIISCTTTTSLHIVMAFMLILHFGLSDVSESISSTNQDAICTTVPVNTSNSPDLCLNVPDLNVDQLSLVAENFKAHMSLSANVASLVSLNGGVDISIDKVNLTINGVQTQLQLAIHLNNVAKIITRTMASLDLNPVLISTIANFTSVPNNEK